MRADRDHPLLLAPNVIAAPHGMGRTDVSYRQQAAIVVEVLESVRAGRDPTEGRVVNEEVLRSEAWLRRAERAAPAARL